MATLRILQGGGTTAVSFTPGEKLDAVLAQAGFAVLHPCAGRGMCGKCAVDVDGERKLSCQTVLTGDCAVRLSSQRMAQIELDGGAELPFAPAEGIGLAVDIGTTTIAIRQYDLSSGTLLSAWGRLNPQTSVAADVMGRVDHAMKDGPAGLQKLVRHAVPPQADRMVITGNTAMLYLYTGRDPSALAHAPFEADCLFDEEIQNLYLPPCMHAFVGADITCAVLASGMADSPDTALLCDVGTNGEMALWHKGVLYVASTAAGPAFEGAGISCGVGSVRGAVERVWAEAGQLQFSTIGGEAPVGLCGSGLIDAVAALLQLGVIDETGAMEEACVSIGGGVTLTGADVRAVQLAKAAVYAGIQTLLCAADIGEDEVERVYLAGGFGRHIHLPSAAHIGLLPASFVPKTNVIGNAALDGASLLLLNPRLREKARRIAGLAQHVPLGGNPLFNENYIEAMMFG